MAMEDLIIRPVATEDFDQLAALYGRHWCLDIPGEADRRQAVRYNLLLELVRSTICIVAEMDGAVVGACLGCVAAEGRPPVNEQWRAPFEQACELIYERAKTVDAELRELLFFDERELEKADRFMAEGSPYAQAQLCLFMVDPDIKGMGLGTRLLHRMHELMRAAGARRYFLMTDTTCDYGYYDRKGMKRLASFPEDPSDPTADVVFLYGGEL